MRVLSVLLVALSVAGSAYSQCSVNDATPAQIDSTYGPTTGGNALTFNDNLGSNIQIANNYDFVSNGVVQLNGGNNLVLTGTLNPVNSSLTDKFSLRAAFVKSGAPSDVKQELNSNAYKANGGPVDPSTWSFYQIIPEKTKMVSLTNPNAVVTMSENPSTALQLGVGANGKNIQNGASGWFQFQATDGTNTAQSNPGGMEVVDININLGCSSTFDCQSNTYSISKASIDSTLTDTQGAQALYVDQVSSVFNNQQKFDTSAGTVNTISIDQTTGNLHLTSGFTSLGDQTTVQCDLRFNPALPNADYMAKLELKNSAYVSGGGSIDPNTWAYYTVNASGSSCTRNDGTAITITGDHDNMYLQWGKGANGKNGNFGLSVWLNYVDAALTNPFFDINVDTVCDNNPSTSMFYLNFTISSPKNFTTIINTLSSLNITQNSTSDNYTLTYIQQSNITSLNPISPSQTSLHNNTSTSIPSLSSSKTSSASSQNNISSSSQHNISSSSSSSKDLPETSPPTAPPATCPPGCIPAIPVVNTTETPAAGNSASNIEMSKLVVAILSLFVLAFFH
ncbi:hypothetical protein RB653_005045 [Dictyostelium firmibasis]|uniref:Uncharacterized protein n=1 Tax=Dictyostelium firmibasis TaxID=79012 RepID=A0AAN7U8R6_9MYCE